VVRRLIDEAGIHRASPKARSTRSRRRATDQHLTQRAAGLGFASLQAYLIDRTTRQAWADAHADRQRAWRRPEHGQGSAGPLWAAPRSADRSLSVRHSSGH
jgi:hypothetical protein